MRELRATYRLQLHAGFTLDDAAGLAGYLAGLGISHVYLSPIQQARAGSLHGYDVVDHEQVSREIGGREALDRLAEALRQEGLGLVLDLVPNHMAIGSDNAWWWDVLENGPSSRFAACFDVEWESPEERLRNLVLVPVLADHYGRILEAGKFKLARTDGVFVVHYEEHALPLAPPTQDGFLRRAAGRCGSEQLAFLADAFGRLPLATATDEASVSRRHRDKEVLRRALARLFHEEPNVAAAVDAEVDALNRDADEMHALLERQNWRLARWRSGQRDLGYRRFFDIDHLAALRVEDPGVFRAVHRLALDLSSRGVVDGFRIDHVDGLREPGPYLQKLRGDAPDAWIVVEKILSRDERLPEAWPVDGTTGYDFLNDVLSLFVDPTGEQHLADLEHVFTGESPDIAELIRAAKDEVLRHGLAADLARLTALALAVCERHRRYRDFTRHELHEALREIVACFGVYRTYAESGAEPMRTGEIARIGEACRAAEARHPELEPTLFAFLRSVLSREIDGPLEVELALRFQQLTAPAHAKGVEDTAFYRTFRLCALNEVGGDPSHFGTTLAEFHARRRVTLERWPRTLLATATHDTKRSEDVRARGVLLSEIPLSWAQAVERFSTLAERFRSDEYPDRESEYLFYQTLVAAWPIEVDRAVAYLQKATREANRHTSWTDPAEAYETAVEGFVRKAFGDAAFVEAVSSFAESLALPGRINSLAQTLIKLTAPGVPDFYQGTELWDGSLVDPDNRRPVDFATRRKLLASLDHLSRSQILARMDEGLPKLWLIRETLRLRSRTPDAFGASGSYEPIWAHGERAGHCVAYVRGGRVAVVAPRLVMGLREGWGHTAISLPDGEWRNVFASEEALKGTTLLGDLLRPFPVALLERIPG